MYENTVVIQDCGRTYANATKVSKNTEPEAADSNPLFKWQIDAPTDLNLTSWPPNKKLPKNLEATSTMLELALTPTHMSLTTESTSRTLLVMSPCFLLFGNKIHSRNLPKRHGHPSRKSGITLPVSKKTGRRIPSKGMGIALLPKLLGGKRVSRRIPRSSS